ncbi:MAG TPA: phage tail protein, partial [Rhodospirillales bacterium]|nr:phage tail protein [Rhodospirillales bacterium]
QKLASGVATANVPVGPIGSLREAQAQGGVGSMLASQYLFARRAAPLQEIWLLPLDDPAGTAATGSFTVDAAPGQSGAALIDVAGVRLSFQVAAADTADDVAANLAAAINAANSTGTINRNMEVTASAALAVVTVSARHVGAAGNDIEIALVTDTPNVLAGNVTVAAMAGGSGVPALDTALAALGDDEADFISGPYADDVSLDSIRDFLGRTSGRWSYASMLYGHYITAMYGSQSALVAHGADRNDPHASILGMQSSPTPPWSFAAAAAGIMAAHLTDAPELSRPLQTLALPGVRPPRARADWWTRAERDALYANAISGVTVDRDGTVRIDRVVTTYQTDSNGVSDRTWHDIETMAQMTFIARTLRAAVSQRHGRQALAEENPHDVAEITTPADIRATLIHAYEALSALGVTEKPDLFADALIVSRDQNDANRVNAYLPMDVVNQLRVFAANITTFLEYREAA